jgi:hypothetical protein
LGQTKVSGTNGIKLSPILINGISLIRTNKIRGEIRVGVGFSALSEARRETQEALGPPMRRAPPQPGKQEAAVRMGRRVLLGSANTVSSP